MIGTSTPSKQKGVLIPTSQSARKEIKDMAKNELITEAEIHKQTEEQCLSAMSQLNKVKKGN